MSTDLSVIFHSKFSPIVNSGLWPYSKESANIRHQSWESEKKKNSALLHSKIESQVAEM